MAIELYTGQPGHGKTQFAIARALELQKTGRAVYIGNVKGIDLEKTGFNAVEDFRKWEDLPDGSVVLWDECYDVLPRSAAGKAVPGYIDALARHRHRGFDFILIAQQTKQLHDFVQGLIERHVHVRRRFGSRFVRLLEWDRYEASPAKAIPLRSSTKRMDPKIWDLYKSATIHTVKRNVPWYFYAFPMLLLAFAYLAWRLPNSFIDKSEKREADALAVAEQPRPGRLTDAMGAPFSNATNGADVYRLDPESALRPRIPGAPWSAPAYDGVAFARPPRLACMSSADSCTCITVEQGTLYAIGDLQCRTYARLGYFDPTYTPQEAPQRVRMDQPAEVRPQQGQASEAGRQAGWTPIPIRSHYVQPQAVKTPKIGGVRG